MGRQDRFAFLEDPSEMTPESRLGEVASILASGCGHLLRGWFPYPPGAPLLTEKPLDVSRGPTPPLGRELTDRDREEDGA
jgi:hypothetical protein